MDRNIATSKIERIIHAIESDKFPVRVRELHVFGSYARGALDPGDLDLIVIHDSPQELLEKIKCEFDNKYGKHSWPSGVYAYRKLESLMRAVMRKPGEKMDIFLGVSMNEINIVGEKVDRVLIWSDSDHNWRERLESIKPDPSAGRYDRGHFANARRFRTDRHTMTAITQDIDKGILKLTRIDAESVKPILNPLYLRRYERTVLFNGKKSAKLYRLAMWWLQEQDGQAYKVPDHFGRCMIHSDDYKYVVYYGNPPLFEACKVGHPFVKVCMIPHFKRGEPNEIFVFEKGDKAK